MNLGSALRATRGNVELFQAAYAATAAAFGMAYDQAVAVAFLIQAQQILPVTLLGVALAPEFISTQAKRRESNRRASCRSRPANSCVREASRRERPDAAAAPRGGYAAPGHHSVPCYIPVVPPLLRTAALACHRALYARSALVVLAVLLVSALPSWRAPRESRLTPSPQATRQRGQRVTFASVPDGRSAMRLSRMAVALLEVTRERSHDGSTSDDWWCGVVLTASESVWTALTVTPRQQSRHIAVAGLSAPSSRAPPQA